MRADLLVCEVDLKGGLGDEEKLELAQVRRGAFRDPVVGLRDLSFGQKRLVEIIRALINPHYLLILDEPIAGVTPELRDNTSKTVFSAASRNSSVTGLPNALLLLLLDDCKALALFSSSPSSRLRASRLSGA